MIFEYDRCSGRLGSARVGSAAAARREGGARSRGAARTNLPGMRNCNEFLTSLADARVVAGGARRAGNGRDTRKLRIIIQ